MKKKVALTIALALLALLLAVAPVSAGAIVTRTEIIHEMPDGFWDGSNCPNGEMEDVYMQGSWVETITTVSDGNGGVRSHFHFNWAGITGTGLTSGDTYVVPQASSYAVYDHQFVEGEGPDHVTFSFSFRVVSKGSGKNFQLKMIDHYIVNANGELTVDKTTHNIMCK